MRALSLRSLMSLLFLWSALADPTAAQVLYDNPADPVLHGDPLDPDTGRVAEMPPGAPWIRIGPDGVLGTSDDIVVPAVRGDVDIVVRSGSPSLAGGIPAPAPLRGHVEAARVEPFGQGERIAFMVLPSDGLGPLPWGRLAVPSYFEKLPFLAVAFADSTPTATWA
jgi:hypothetical protein